MKFSWKLCFATILISLVTFSIGGYVLISALFQSTYEREIENAVEENQMFQYSFVAYWNTTVQDSKITKENIEKTANVMIQNRKDGRIRISDKDQNVLYDNTESAENQELLDTITANLRGYCLRKTGNRYELQTASMIQMEEEEILYIETIRDVTAIFEERDEQYRIYQWWMMGILLIESLCCYVMAMWLLRPLKHLTKTTGRIAEGNLSVRAQVTTKDEFGELSVSFNEMADSLEKQVQELEMAAKRQEDFIGSFAHELKTPLTSMIGYADMLRSQELKPEERFEAANYIFKEGKRLEALSFKLLELLVVQKEELEKKWVPIQWISEDIEGILKPSLEKAGIRLNVMMEKARLFIEPDLMKTVLLNLLDNGRKAIEAKGELHLLGRKEEGGYAIYVKDSGKGMPKKEISRITEAFYMIDKSRAREQGGAGLGLSICAEIVKRHQGTLQFQSIEGQGTIVRIFLPKEAVK